MLTLDSALVFDRSDRGKLRATGTEVAVFLHNLTTNDIKALAANSGCEGFFCTSTAKVIAYGWFWKHAPKGKSDTVDLDLPAGEEAKVLPHLDRYLISEDVTLSDLTQSLAQFHLVGPDLLPRLAQLGLHLNEWRLGLLAAQEEIQIRCFDPLGTPGIDILCSRERADSLKERLTSAGFNLADHATWERLRILAGNPAWGSDVTETTFAPETGRIPQAICYTKGCYLGQEPIVMARDRGAVQRILVNLRSATPLDAGSPLQRDGKEVGKITSSTALADGSFAALGYVKRTLQAPGNEFTTTQGTAQIVQRP
jgi:folate-binding protein YgfZ